MAFVHARFALCARTAGVVWDTELGGGGDFLDDGMAYFDPYGSEGYIPGTHDEPEAPPASPGAMSPGGRGSGARASTVHDAEPDQVMLDGTVASSLESAKGDLTAAE